LRSSGDEAASALATTHKGGVLRLAVAPVLVLAHVTHGVRVLPVLAAADIALRTISAAGIACQKTSVTKTACCPSAAAAREC
jgi:hypothetical protein